VIYRFVFRVLLQRIDAERAHSLALRVLRAVAAVPPARAVLRRLLGRADENLRVGALGLTFPSPLGVAAGLDKDASSYEGLGALGFGFVEVGTITALPQRGNPRPRVFRLPGDRAFLNRMGFPNPGAKAAARRLRRRSGRTVVGVNVGKSRAVPIEGAADDYRATVREAGPHADYLVINVSSPNTPGLRDMQAAAQLRALVAEVRRELEAAELSVPLLVKIGPDLSDGEIDAVADAALALELDGIVAVNTTVDRGVLAASAAPVDDGGISGAPLKARALEVLQRLSARAGDGLVLISVGGVETPADAWERILAGATLVQAYTGFVYGGPAWPRRMNRALTRMVAETGAPSVADLVGTAEAQAAEGRAGAKSTGAPASRSLV
jgi:dihydroorotate dehydrogenase